MNKVDKAVSNIIKHIRLARNEIIISDHMDIIEFQNEVMAEAHFNLLHEKNVINTNIKIPKFNSIQKSAYANGLKIVGKYEYSVSGDALKINYIEKIGEVQKLSVKVYDRLIKAKKPNKVFTRLTKSNSGRGSNMGMPKFNSEDEVINFLYQANNTKGVPHKKVYEYMIKNGWKLNYQDGYLIYTKQGKHEKI